MIKLENEYGNLSVEVHNARDYERHIDAGWHIVDIPLAEGLTYVNIDEPKAAPAAKKTTKKAAKKK